MRRNGFTRGNHVIRTCLLAAFLVGSLFAPRISAQTVDSYRQRAAELSRVKSWDEALANYRKALELDPNDAVTHYHLAWADRKSTRLNSSHLGISYAVFC